MKKCTKCSKLKEFDGFCKSSRMKDGYQNWCKLCMTDNTMSRYKKDKTKFNKRNAEYKKRKQLQFYKWLKGKCCVDCNESNILVLEFDHVKKGTKFKDISRLCNEGYKWAVIEEEIKKCEIVCANCHKIRTAYRGEWVKLEFIAG